MIEIRTVPLETAGIELETRSGKPRIKGLAIPVNKLSHDLGGFRERIRPEALHYALAQQSDILALLNHSQSAVLGRTGSGTLEVRITPAGLHVEIDPPNTTHGNDTVESIRRRDITGMSFGFKVPKAGDRFSEENGIHVRDVFQMNIAEVSVATMPAYPQTDVAVRSLQEYLAQEPKLLAALARQIEIDASL